MSGNEHEKEIKVGVARIVVHPDFVTAPVSRRTFGTFVEHLGRCVYTGIYEPGHPRSNEQGLRQDVLELVRELGVSTVRYPGGNFVSGYRWEDGIGPVEERPKRLDLAWHSTEPNTFGLDEFMRWIRATDAEPMMAVNLGTRGVLEALDLQEYCNAATDTAWSRRRAENGSADPYRVRLWCLGNEMDGPWQEGHKTPQEYGRLAAETARAMRMVEPNLELIVCGSSASDMPLFGEWERVVLSEAFEQVDYVSIHRYYEERNGDMASFLASTVDMDHFIRSVVATVDHVAAVKKSPKQINLAFDEWNVWYQSGWEGTDMGYQWPEAPALLEDHYTVADAVVVGSMLITLLRHSDRVTIANQAQLVNVIAPIMTEPGGLAWKQTIFHPFAITSRNAVGQVLQTRVSATAIGTAVHGAVPQVDAVCTWDSDSNRLALFAVNRSTSDTVVLEVDVTPFGHLRVSEALVLSDEDPHARNTPEEPDRVRVQPLGDAASVEGGRLRVQLPAVAWASVCLSLQ